MTTLRSPFAEALHEALRHAHEDHAYPTGILEIRWRGYLETAQEFADARAAGMKLPDWRKENFATPTLAYALLAFMGEDPPVDLLEEVSRRIRTLEENDPNADRRNLPDQANVTALIRTVCTVRHLIEKFRPNRRLS